MRRVMRDGVRDGGAVTGSVPAFGHGLGYM